MPAVDEARALGTYLAPNNFSQHDLDECLALLGDPRQCFPNVAMVGGSGRAGPCREDPTR